MYHRHFGLAGEPFSLTPDPASLFPGRQHREALAAIEYAVREGRGFATVVGEVGTGKTTLLYALASRLAGDASIAYVSSPATDLVELLRVALRDFGVAVVPGMDRLGLLDALNAHLLAMADAGRPTALVIDEAQNLNDETFEQLRLLSNFETFTRKLLQIVLAGQPELEARLARPGLRQLRERISVRTVLEPLPRDEMQRYLAHRLARVGGTLDVFEPRALRVLVRRAAGIPRRANILCHNALLFTYGRGMPRVSIAVAREVVRDLHGRPTHWPARLRVVRWASFGGLALATSASLVVGAVGRAPRATLAPVVATAAMPAPTDVARAEPASPPGDDRGPVIPAEPSTTPTEPPANGADAATAAVAAEPVAVLVPPGATLLGLAREAYGIMPDRRAHADFFGAVQRLNPGLRDVDLIRPGERLLLPPPSSDGAARPPRGRG